MPDPRAHDLRGIRPDGRMLSATALRSTKAGLVAICIVSFALVTFGPWFNLLLGYGLMFASMAVAVIGIWWADRAAHQTQWNHEMTNGIYAKSGATVSIVALLLSMYYTGLLVVILFSWPIWLIALLVLWAFHRAWVDSGVALEARA